MRGEIPEPNGRPALHNISPDSDVSDHRAGVAALIRARSLREQLLPAEWFADVAWDLMLQLYLEHLHDAPLTLQAIASGGRANSRRRWIDVIVAEGLAVEKAQAVQLSATGVAAMRSYFAKMAQL